jgi:hypothetical protein
MAISHKLFPTAPAALFFFAAYCFVWFFLPPCYNDHSFVASIIDKHKALERAHSPKIVFVGGSNLALGLDSAQVQKATGEDVVNMGVSRLFGLRYCLEEIKDSIQPNDTIVIVPEYENFYGEMNGSAYLMNVGLLMPRAIPWIWRAYATSPERINALATDVVGVLNYKWTWWRQHANQYLNKPGAAPTVASLYNPSEPPNFSRKNFTADGDFTGHLATPPPSYKYFKLCDGLKNKIDPETARVLNDFNVFAKAHGAQVVMLPPPLPKQVYLAHKKQVDDVYVFCRQSLTFPVLSPPDRYVFASKYFFNSLYHLCGTAREQRTALILQDLETHAQTASKTKSGSLRL